MSEAAELDARSVPMSWVMDQDIESIELAKLNLLPRIAKFVQRRLLLSTRYTFLTIVAAVSETVGSGTVCLVAVTPRSPPPSTASNLLSVKAKFARSELLRILPY